MSEATQFQTREALDAYLSMPRIECLLCGRRMHALDPHLRAAHDMTGDEYRDLYGIPKTVGLCGTLHSERKRQDAARRWDEMDEEARDARTSPMRAALPRSNDPKPKRANKPPYWKKARTKHTVETWREFARRVKEGRTYRDVSSDADMPHYAALPAAFERLPGLRSWWYEYLGPTLAERPGRKPAVSANSGATSGENAENG
jgi:hypothetical protein